MDNLVDDSQAPIDVREISIYDLENSKSILRLCENSPKMRKAIIGADQILMCMDEALLREKLNPSAIDNRLRLAFWYEIDLILNSPTPRKFVDERVYGGVVTRDVWEKKYLCNPRKMAWILTPTGNYESAMTEMIETGLAQMRRILSAPIFDDGGRLDTKAAKLVFDAFKYVDERAKGTLPQRVHVLHQHSGPGAQQAAGPAIDLDEKIADLERQIALNNSKHGGNDGTSEEEDY